MPMLTTRPMILPTIGTAEIALSARLRPTPAIALSSGSSIALVGKGTEANRP
jgi:hypothetical protein